MAVSMGGPNIGHLPQGYADLPQAVFEHVLSYLKTSEILQAAQVCSSWQAIIDHNSFWFSRVKQALRMHPRFPDFNQILNSEQLAQSLQSDTIRFLKGICLNREDRGYFLSHIKGTGNNMDIGHSWDIEDEDVMAVSVLLMFRRPQVINITFRTDPAKISLIDVFLFVLSFHKDCKIWIRNLGGWRCLLNSHKQPLKHVDAYERIYEQNDQVNHVNWPLKMYDRFDSANSPPVSWLWTAVDKCSALPRNVQHLFVGLLEDPDYPGKIQDPDLSSYFKKCETLKQLGLHVRAGCSVEHLPPLPEMIDKYDRPCICLYLSEVESNHLEWTVKTARSLQSRSGYRSLALPDCRLQMEQLYQLVVKLKNASVKVTRSLMVSSQHCREDETHLRTATRTNLKCDLTWKQNDDELPWW